MKAMMGMMIVLMVLAVDGQDDARADLDIEAMAGGDADSDADSETEVVEKEKSMIWQTSLAIQQFSIIIVNFFKQSSSFDN